MMYAEKCNYWKSSKSSPDSWLEKSIGLIEQNGGELLSSGFGTEHNTGRAAYMVRFALDGQVFHIVWPVLPSETGDTYAARRQAATMMYHDIKAKCVAAQALGNRVAFFSWLELPSGRPAYRLADEELESEVPQMMLGNHTRRIGQEVDRDA